MKHYSAAALRRLVTEPMRSEADLVGALRSQLVSLGGDDRAKRLLAQRLGIRQPELTRILRCQIPVPSAVAAKMGLRRVSMFEPID